VGIAPQKTLSLTPTAYKENKAPTFSHVPVKSVAQSRPARTPIAPAVYHPYPSREAVQTRNRFAQHAGPPLAQTPLSRAAQPKKSGFLSAPSLPVNAIRPPAPVVHPPMIGNRPASLRPAAMPVQFRRAAALQAGAPIPAQPGTAPRATTASTSIIQRVIKISPKDMDSEKSYTTNDDAQLLWKSVQSHLNVISKSDEQWMKNKLTEWVKTPETINAVWARLGYWSQKRSYYSEKELAKALLGELRQHSRHQNEINFAKRKQKEITKQDSAIAQDMVSLMKKLYKFIKSNIPDKEQDKINKVNTDWKYWTPYLSTLLDQLKNPTAGYKLNYAFFRNAAFPVESHIKKMDETADVGPGKMKGHVSSSYGNVESIPLDFRHGEYNVTEKNPWVKRARLLSIPLMAGPSNTMIRLYRLATFIGATKNEINALAWNSFVFHTLDFFSTRSLSHTLHEIMDIGVEFGVKYSPTNYDSFTEFDLESISKEWNLALE
jgi:hypothetical protein